MRDPGNLCSVRNLPSFSSLLIHILKVVRWLVGNKIRPRDSKTLPRDSKTLPRIQKHFSESKNTSQNPKYFREFKNTSQVFWLFRCVFGFWYVFWILGSVLERFVPMSHGTEVSTYSHNMTLSPKNTDRASTPGLDTHIMKNRLNMFPEIPDFFLNISKKF